MNEMAAPTSEASEPGAETFLELSRRAAMLGAVGYAATLLIGGTDWRAGVEELLRRMGLATGASRASLFEVHRVADGRMVQSCRFDWAEPPLRPISDDPRYAEMSLGDEEGEIGDWTLRRMRGEVVQALRSEVSGYTRQVYEEQGTLSFVSVPVTLSNGEWWGFIGFDDCRVERHWSALEIEVLRIAAALIAGAVERERTHARLRLSEERYALAARGANDGLWDWQVDTNEAYFSPRLHEILGRRKGELEGGIGALVRALAPEDGALFRNILDRRFAKLRHRLMAESRAILPDGGVRWIIIRGQIVYRDGTPVRVVGSVRDITDRKLAEQRLMASEARLRTILDTAGDAIVSVDSGGGVVEFNRAAERIFGYAREEVIGRPMAPLLVPPHLHGAHAAGMARYLGGGPSHVIGRHVEVEALRADGSTLPIELAISEIKLPGEHLFTAFLRDITERRSFEQKLAEAERRRANLARYFSPKMVERMMQQDGRLDAVRLPRVAVLFADMIGFGAISRFAPGEETIQLLREFHALIAQAVFEHEGSLDKYMGDGLMATFGTPEPGPKDAANAVACARAMAASVVAWSNQRHARGLPAIQIGIGLHWGEVTLGDIGSERHPEFTVVGDTVNLASRIEELTRQLRIGILASAEILRAVQEEGGKAMLEGFRDFGLHPVRGRSELVRIWGRTADDLAG
ncbi:MAG TPA: PAS domain S-box protein [Methylomirabilota bacterium]|jgi:PAS domain S-box-containing protein|nr:PAS domain S-box protein [Methylomirabilota bacterium]